MKHSGYYRHGYRPYGGGFAKLALVFATVYAANALYNHNHPNGYRGCPRESRRNFRNYNGEDGDVRVRDVFTVVGVSYLGYNSINSKHPASCHYCHHHSQCKTCNSEYDDMNLDFRKQMSY
ncbi:hypothetical protein JA1_002370 [Spathaspora sp. JA1]|nr:hypothetical protein JA1_002370 [Spathaspora sp. JA1]